MAIQSIFDNATCFRKGLCQVHNSLQSHSIYYEQHGTGPEKILFIMGLNSGCFAWANQIEYFGNSPKYSAVVFDNRGVGNSDTPRGPYTTSAMAQDTIVLLDHLDWTAQRDLHVVGISLGGMIAQELAMRIPDRIVSLTLAVTTAGGSPWSNLPPWKGFSALTKLLFIKDPAVKIPVILDTVFPNQWLDEKAENDPAGRTNREIQTAAYLRRMEVTRPQTLIGSLSQMAAATTHRVDPSRLRSLSSSIPKVLILTGDQDNLIDSQKSWYLKDYMPDAEFVVIPGTGHVIQMQRKEQMNELLVRVFQEGRDKVTEER